MATFSRVQLGTGLRRDSGQSYSSGSVPLVEARTDRQRVAAKRCMRHYTV